MIVQNFSAGSNIDVYIHENYSEKIIHETHGKTSCFTLSNRFKIQSVEITGQMI